MESSTKSPVGAVLFLIGLMLFVHVVRGPGAPMNHPFFTNEGVTDVR